MMRIKALANRVQIYVRAQPDPGEERYSSARLYVSSDGHCDVKTHSGKQPSDDDTIEALVDEGLAVWRPVDELAYELFLTEKGMRQFSDVLATLHGWESWE